MTCALKSKLTIEHQPDGKQGKDCKTLRNLFNNFTWINMLFSNGVNSLLSCS